MLSSTQSSLCSSQIYTVILAADIQHSTHSELSPRLNQQRAKETIVRSRTNSRIPCDWFTSQGAAVDIVRKLNFFVGLLGPEWSLRPVGFCLSLWKKVLTGVQRWNGLFGRIVNPFLLGMHWNLIERYLRIRRVVLQSPRSLDFLPWGPLTPNSGVLWFPR